MSGNPGYTPKNKQIFRVFFSLLLCLSSLLFAALPFLSLSAQSSVILTLSLPPYLVSNFTPEIFQPFEADHPGVKVVIAKPLGDDQYFPPAAYEPEKFFSGSEKVASSADVILIDSYNFSVEGTRAGYYLDMTPLVKGDSALNSDDFFPVAWQSFQWDGGTWAMPISLDVMIMSYLPDAFDKIGLAYPNAEWTVDDLLDAARKLTEKDANGKITRPGLGAFNNAPLFYSLAGAPFYDPSTSPVMPKFETPALEHIVEAWNKWQSEQGSEGFQGDYNTIPMRIDGAYALADNSFGSEKPRAGSLLPGGKAGVTVQGFAISGGTQHPDEAYALVKFLTSDTKVISRFFGFQPARKSLVGVSAGDDAVRFEPKFSPENKKIIDDALANAIPVAEYRFFEYINQAIGAMTDKKLDAKTALKEAETKANANLKLAADKHSVQTLVVATPVPTPVLKAGEASLKFMISANISPLPNREKWDALISEFIASDPQVKHIELMEGMGSTFNDMVTKYDCMSIPYNILQLSDATKLLPLDPMLAADNSLDKTDFIGSALAQMQQNNQTYGLPIYLQPEILRFDAKQFEKAGIALPTADWTIDAFNDALKSLKPGKDDPIPFVPRYYSGTYILMLIAANGALPIDNRVTPEIINFTAPATVDVIRQVLDQARAGYIKYSKLANNMGGGGGGNITDPIYTDLLGFYGRMGSEQDPYKVTSYPKGSNFTPVSYSVGAGYISAQSTYPEGCYRWLSTVAQHPELFNAMPARHSQLDNAGVTTQGPDLAASYKTIAQSIQDPNAVLIYSTSFGSYLEQFFLFRAFDRYVLEQADLDTQLKEAEAYAKAVQECVAQIPPNTATTQKDEQEHFKKYTECAIKIDPSLKSMFGQ